MFRQSRREARGRPRRQPSRQSRRETQGRPRRQPRREARGRPRRQSRREAGGRPRRQPSRQPRKEARGRPRRPSRREARGRPRHSHRQPCREAAVVADPTPNGGACNGRTSCRCSGVPRAVWEIGTARGSPRPIRPLARTAILPLPRTVIHPLPQRARATIDKEPSFFHCHPLLPFPQLRWDRPLAPWCLRQRAAMGDRAGRRGPVPDPPNAPQSQDDN
ncbi:uncharacterized protein LOC130907974 [Corythoichthys intestinalis]|uniref:uncharacterized protein LOC130907974 n=1 Tax=Corythoichthys intestinalis TaxID=161448 RepID=UPI0025A52637|nr:uncharacterized protein LOC130907974 [Corythoichthys intestinalis]